MLRELARHFAGRQRIETPPERHPVDFPACIQRMYPAEFPAARLAAEDVLEVISQKDLSSLSRHSPGLRHFNWSDYLRCSMARVVRVIHTLRQRGLSSGRVLDYGSCFGNFSLALADTGYAMEAVDSYRSCAPALDSVRQLMLSRSIGVHDFSETGYELSTMAEGCFDAVLCMGVLEHVPHTPRAVLTALNRVLAPGGLFVLDTPNLAYEFRRRQLQRGESIFLPIELQYDTAVPFEGHHREYTTEEVRWLLEQLGQEELTVETFDYSRLALPWLEGESLEIYRAGVADPSRRELILAAGRKPSA